MSIRLIRLDIGSINKSVGLTVLRQYSTERDALNAINIHTNTHRLTRLKHLMESESVNLVFAHLILFSAVTFRIKLSRLLCRVSFVLFFRCIHYLMCNFYENCTGFLVFSNKFQFHVSTTSYSLKVSNLSEKCACGSFYLSFQ